MGALEQWEPTLLALAARCLRVRPEVMDPSAPLARYGLDSLNALELALAIREATGIQLNEEALLDSPSINQLSKLLLGRISTLEEAEACLSGMRADAQLPADIDPMRVPASTGESVLLTGASGFLGAHVLATLLASGASSVVCPVRAASDSAARVRVSDNLRRYGLDASVLDDRVDVIAADIGQPSWGLPQARYVALAECVESIVHVAALVNWVSSYEGLRGANVGVTAALLRFACTEARKAFHFVSSAAACYSTRARAALCEDDPPSDLAGIHLGYGQSKWVAERLVQAAQERGLPAVVYRPSLISGSSATGLGNDDDLLALMLRGCIALGHAPDLDWELDACPVDHVGEAIAAAVMSKALMNRVVHLRNARPARWSETILWMNLRGYPVRLEPFGDWIERVERDSRAVVHPLHRLRGFLLRRIEAEGGAHLPQLYARPYAAPLVADASKAALAELGVTGPRLGAQLLERYFAAWVRRGVLQQGAHAGAGRSVGSATRSDRDAQPAPVAALHAASADWDAALEAAFRSYFAEPELRVTGSVTREFGAEHSILGELASWRAGSDLSLHARKVHLTRADGRHSCIDIVVKPKLPNALILDVATNVAAQCDAALGTAFEAYREQSEFAAADLREIALYCGARGALRAHMPVFFGAIDCGGTSALVLERVRDAAVIDSVDRPASWTRPHIEAALLGAARIHAEWRGCEIRLDGCRVSPLSSLRHVSPQARAWWLALARHARPWLDAWLGRRGVDMQLRLVAGADERATAAAAHVPTLIHHDFNPRNIALRQTPLGPQLCAFDWELAAYGLPQRDVVELLCFVLDPAVQPAVVDHHIEYARLALERAALQRVDSAEWRSGARLALADFGVRRLPMYFIAHRFRPQAFLERVTRTWWRLLSILGV